MPYRFLLCLMLSALLCNRMVAQVIAYPSTQPVHAAEFHLHRSSVINDITASGTASVVATDKGLSHLVFGYYPYWASANSYEQLDYQLLTHLCYFSADVDSNGKVSLMNSERLPLVRDYARERNTKVILAVTSFGYNNNDKLFGDAVRARQVISRICGFVREYSLDGLNIDAELVRTTQRSNMTQFMRWLRDSLNTYNPAAELSMATPAVDWSNAFDLGQLASLCNYLVMMGYDYYYSGSETAGPVAPLAGENYTVTRSVETYLQIFNQRSVAESKLLLGVPWYGYEWAVTDTTRKSARDVSRGAGKSLTYATAARRSQYVRRYDSLTHSLRYNLRDSTGYFQGWYDDSTTMSEKYELLKAKKLGGVGIWALTYQGTDGKMWEALRDAFVHLTSVPEQEEKHSLLVMPQPAQDMLCVDLPHSATIRIYDILGSLYYTVTAESGRVFLDCRTLPSGSYWLRAHDITVPFVIER